MSPLNRPSARAQGMRSFLGLALLSTYGLLASCGDPPAVSVAGGDGTDELREFRVAAAAEVAGGGWLAGSSVTHYELLAQLDALEVDTYAKGAFIRLGPLGGSWARAQELHAALERVKAASKPVHCHFETIDNAGYLVASACDRVTMSPSGSLDFVGVAAQLFYARPMLEKLGLRADVIRMGQYKSAADTFTRDDMPPETELEMGQLLDGLQSQLLTTVGAGRGLSPEALTEILATAPLSAEAARNAKLIDDVEYDDEARQHLRVATSIDAIRQIRLGGPDKGSGVSAIVSAMLNDGQEESPEEDHVALVYLTGTIQDGPVNPSGGTAGDPFVAQMRAAADDPKVKAVVLRIDSPGGSALASDRMWQAVRTCARRKPVIASIGDMAASGGYYVAAAATTVYAEPTSIVGSIGVIGGKLVASELSDRIGIKSEILTRGPNAALGDMSRPFSQSERAVLTQSMQSTYHRFIRRVAELRPVSREDVLRQAGGRVFLASAGKEGGLVDEFGGLWDALRTARELGAVSRDTPMTTWPGPRSMLDSLGGLGGVEARSLVSGVPPQLLRPYERSLSVASLLSSGERQFVLLPAWPTIQ